MRHETIASEPNLTSHPDRRGISCTLMLATLLPLLVIAGTMLSVESSQLRETESLQERARARSIAAGGAHDALARLEVDPAFAGRYTVDLDSGTAVVTIVDCATNGEDDDANGRVDDATETDLVSVRSEGFVAFDLDVDGAVVADHGRNWRGLTQVLLRRTSLETTFDAALYIEDPLAGLHFSGNAFLVSGNDVGLDMKPTKKPAQPGIGTPGNPSKLKSSLTKSQKNNVVGKGGAPSVQQVADVELTDLLETFGPLATMRWKDGEQFHGAIGDRVKLVPVVAHAAGDLTLAGKTTGCGILLVDGDLDIGGSLDFAGIVVVGGRLLFHGGGSRTLLGALLVGGDVDDQSALKGSMTIQLSSAAVDLARTVATGFEVVAWRES
jgi:hypothetical protein